MLHYPIQVTDLNRKYCKQACRHSRRRTFKRLSLPIQFMHCARAPFFTNKAKRTQTTEVDTFIKPDDECGWICWKTFGCSSFRRWILHRKRIGAGIRSWLVSVQSARMNLFVHRWMGYRIAMTNRNARRLESFTANGGLYNNWLVSMQSPAIQSLTMQSVRVEKFSVAV